MTQSSLGDFGADVPEADVDGETPGGSAEEDGTQNRGYSRRQIALKRAPEGAEPYADDSCPWCLGSADDFIVKTNDDVNGELPRSPQTSCGHCGAVIPTHMDWYQRGEKIAFERHDL